MAYLSMFAGRLYFLLALFFFLFPMRLQADSLPLATVEFPPFHYEEEGQLTGVLTEIVIAVVRRMGHEADIRAYPTKRAKRLS